MRDKISVVVPVYNVERYLLQCVDSIVNQSYRNLEIILIDDGSTDNSGKICDAYAEKDKRIRVIHQENGGAASAKNVGLRIASGEYLTFVDSDDFLEADAYSYMLSMIKEHHADVIQCSYRDVYLDKQIEQIVEEDLKVCRVEEYLKRYTYDWTCGLLWDKLYRRNLFSNIYFEEGHIIDDDFFTYQGIMNACKIVLSPQIVYNYRKRKSSVTADAKNRERIIMDQLDYLVKRRENISLRFPELKTTFDKHFIDVISWMARDAYSTKESIEAIKKIIKEYMNKNNHCLIDLRTRIDLYYIRWSGVSTLLRKKREKGAPHKVEQYFE